jgi:hypothetical protein
MKQAADGQALVTQGVIDFSGLPGLGDMHRDTFALEHF